MKILLISEDSAKLNYARLNMNNTLFPNAKFYTLNDDDGRCLAMASVTKLPGYYYGFRMGSREEQFYHLSHFLVDEEMRGRGLGRTLLEHLLKVYPDLVLAVDKQNDVALNLYRSLGFTLLKTKPNRPHQWIMARFTKPRGYSSVALTKPSADYLRACFPMLDITDDLHASIIFDEELKQNYVGDIPQVSYDLRPIGLRFMGEEGSEWCAIALECVCSELTLRQQKLLQMGYTSKFPDYIIHISLVYGATKAQLEELMKLNVRLPSKLTADSEQWDKLQD